MVYIMFMWTISEIRYISSEGITTQVVTMYYLAIWTAMRVLIHFTGTKLLKLAEESPKYLLVSINNVLSCFLGN